MFVPLTHTHTHTHSLSIILERITVHTLLLLQLYTLHFFFFFQNSIINIIQKKKRNKKVVCVHCYIIIPGYYNKIIL